MRVISRFTDYYDSAMAMGVDKTIIYKRESQELSITDHQLQRCLNTTFDIKNDKVDVMVHPFIILFCGQAYPLLHLTTGGGGRKNIKFCNFYSIEDYLSFIKKENKRIHKENMTIRSHYTWSYRETECFTIMRDFCATINNDIFFKYNAPILLVEGGIRNKAVIITTNPELKSFEFYKKFDAYSAFQEIDMYISGVLCSHSKPMIRLSNLDMAKKHGHDHKYSFKKEPH